MSFLPSIERSHLSSKTFGLEPKCLRYLTECLLAMHNLCFGYFRTMTRFSSDFGLRICLFTNFEGVEHLKEITQELYDPNEYKFT
jgi:hypothetical protein